MLAVLLTRIYYYDLPVLIGLNDSNSRRHQDTAWFLTTQTTDAGCYMTKCFYWNNFSYLVSLVNCEAYALME